MSSSPENYTKKYRVNNNQPEIVNRVTLINNSAITLPLSYTVRGSLRYIKQERPCLRIFPEESLKQDILRSAFDKVPAV